MATYRKRKTKRSAKLQLVTVLVTLLVLASAYIIKNNGSNGIMALFNPHASTTQNVSATDNSELLKLQYDGTHQVVTVNNNTPDFSPSEVKSGQKSGQTFAPLDKFNRAGTANAVLSIDLMPHEEREPLYVDPTGWKNKKISTGWLYNRSHLIGYQLTGENNNLKNLITGTRSLNSPSMLDYENQVAAYLKNTGNQVRYRVTPVFSGDELVARGVHMEAQSIQNNKLHFNVYIFNIEKGVIIDYSDGSSHVEK